MSMPMLVCVRPRHFNLSQLVWALQEFSARKFSSFASSELSRLRRSGGTSFVLFCFVCLFFCGGIEWTKCISEGAKKSRNLPKMADFDIFSPSDWGQLGQSLWLGGEFPHTLPPLDAATASALVLGSIAQNRVFGKDYAHVCSSWTQLESLSTRLPLGDTKRPKQDSPCSADVESLSSCNLTYPPLTPLNDENVQSLKFTRKEWISIS